MTENSSHAPGGPGHQLDNGSGELKSTKSPTKPKGISHLRTLEAIAHHWGEQGYYDSSGRAFDALIKEDV